MTLVEGTSEIGGWRHFIVVRSHDSERLGASVPSALLRLGEAVRGRHTGSRSMTAFS